MWDLRRRAVWIILAILSIVACAGCQTPSFTRERYDTIFTGEPAQEVRAKLGEPDRSTPEHWDYVNRLPTRYEARIWFASSGQVARKEWYQGKKWFDEGE